MIAKIHHRKELQSLNVSTRQVDPFVAMDVLTAANAREAAGRPTYHLEVGQPGAPTPTSIRQAAHQALDAGAVGYTEAAGMGDLKTRIAAHYQERYAMALEPERVMVTTGSSAGFSLAFLLVCNPGDRIALPRPGYPAYRNIVRALGLEPVEIDLQPDKAWSLSPAQLEAAHAERPIRAVLIASPNNPTGTVMPKQAMVDLMAFCRRAGIWYLSDEIYHGLVFDGQETCALEIDDQAIIINSFSKYYCMTGWRIGWMVLPQRLVRRAEALAQNLYICPPTLSQAAALAAFDAVPALEAIKQGYAANRERLLQTQKRLALTNGPSPDGAFYMYWPVHRLLKPGATASQLCRTVLDETGIALTPGVDFDPVNGEHYVRVSFAGSQETVSRAADLFEDWAGARGEFMAAP